MSETITHVRWCACGCGQQLSRFDPGPYLPACELVVAYGALRPRPEQAR